MKLQVYQVDAFASKIFGGNPAAVCPLESWLPESLMQRIAMENNLSETAFFVPEGDRFRLRWFTPAKEVKLCGHATLASAFVLFELLGWERDTIVFETLSGALTVGRSGDFFEMDFPAQPPKAIEAPTPLTKAFTAPIVECLASEDYIAVLENEKAVRNAAPDLLELKKLDRRGVIITAPADAPIDDESTFPSVEPYDFVARFFAPNYGIDEDPVTGSAYTQLLPYWAEKLGKKRLFAHQASQRGGDVRGALLDDRVLISGKAALFLSGSAEI